METSNLSVLVQISLNDGSVLSVDMDKLWSGGFSYETATSNSGTFDAGAAIIGKLTLKLNNMYKDFDGLDFTGAVIKKAQVLVEHSDHTETINKGVFTVDSATYDNGIITLECLDNLHLLDVAYSESNLVYPASALDIVKDVCSCCGLLLATDSLRFNGYKFEFSTRPESEDETTFRDVLTWIGECTGNFWKCNGNGELTAGWYDAAGLEDGTNAHTLSTSEVTDVVPKLDDVVITGVKVITEDSENSELSTISGEEGYMVSIEQNDLVTENNYKEIATMAGAQIVGLTFRPVTISMLQDPTIEAGDGVIVSDADGNTYKTFVTNVTFGIDSDTQLTNDAEAAIRNSAQRFSQSTKIYQKINRKLTYQKSEFDKSLDKLQQAMDEKQGLYPIEVTESDGSTTLYFCDKPKLEDAKTVIKLNASGWGMSTDSGSTWNTGMLVDGTVIAKILDTIGVNADWIDTGALTVKDTTGNVIFSADVDTGTVYISGDNVTIGGGKTLNDAMKEFSENAKNLTISLSNDYQAISVDSDGNYTTFPDCSTTVTVMYGSVNVSNACTYSCLTSDSITGEWSNDSTRTYTVKGLSADTGWVDITATYNTALKVTKRFSISKVYDGADGQTYMLDSDISVFKTGRNGTQLSVKSVTFSAYKQLADGSREPYSGRFVIEEISKNYSRVIYTSTEDESEITEYLDTGLATLRGGRYDSGWKYYGLYPLADADGSILLTDNALDVYGEDIESVQCKLYASGGTTVLIDKMLINRVIDVSLLGQEDVYNLLTNNGQWQGIYKNSDGNMYINFSYAHGGTLKLGGQNNTNGSLTVYNANGNQVGYWDKDGIHATSGKFDGNCTFGGKLEAASGTFNGDISAAGGTFSGNIRVVGKGDAYSDYYIELNNGAGKTSPYLLLAEESAGFTDDDSAAVSSDIVIAKLDGTDGLVANKGKFSGDIYATGGTIGGWTIGKNSSGAYYLKATNDTMRLYSNGKILLGSNCNIVKNGDYGAQISGGLEIRLPSASSDLTDGSENLSIYNMSSGTGTQMVIGSGNYVYRSASSARRYKDVDRDLTDADIEGLYDIQPVRAKYKDGYLVKGDELEGKYIPMFIADEIEEIFPEATLHNADGSIEDWNHRIMIPAMFQMIKSQKSMIDSLNERIVKLEASLLQNINS